MIIVKDATTASQGAGLTAFPQRVRRLESTEISWTTGLTHSTLPPQRALAVFGIGALL